MEFKIGIDKIEAELVKKKLTEFYGKNYWGADDKFFEWMYFKNPNKSLLCDKDKYSFLIFKDKNEILALDSFYCEIIIYRNKKYLAIWDIEWNNFSNIKGLGSQLVQKMHILCDVYLGYGYNSLSYKSFKKLDCNYIEEIERYVLIFEPDILKDILNIPKNSEYYDFYKFSANNIKLVDNINYIKISDISKIENKYYIDYLSRFEMAINKNVDYINWRYLSHPYIEYDIISTDTNGKCGIAVVRKEFIKNYKYCVVRILDFFPTFGNEKKLLGGIINYCQKQKAILVDFFCVSQKIKEKIDMFPFLPLTKHRQFFIPRLFQPLEIRERQSINFVYKILNKEIENSAINDLYATKGDGDQDIKVNREYQTVSL